MRRTAAIFVLLCATVHCVLSIFYVNTSYLNLHNYASGTERQPFQRRLLMVPILHWAESNHALQSAARRFGANVPQPEPMSAAKLACILLSIVLLAAFGLWSLRVAQLLGLRHRWLLWAFTLAILYASYAARYEQPLWYPYDIPHLVVFGIAAIFVLTDQPFAFAVAFAVDAPIRETSVFLLPLALLVHLRSKSWRIAIAACCVIWGLTRILAQHLYPNGAHEWNGLHWYAELKPWHLPQLFSIAGFVVIPVWLGLRHLLRAERLFLYAASAMMLFTFYFATWNETRAWSEWTIPFAVLAALELERSLLPAIPSPPPEAPPLP